MLLTLALLVACGGEGEGQITVAPQGTPTGALQRVEPTAEASAASEPVATATETAAAQPTQAATATEEAPVEEPTAAPPPPTEEPAAPVAQPLSGLTLAPLVQGLNSPTYLTHAGDGRLFITEQDGRIQVVQDGQLAAEPFLDITDRVGFNSNEQGLLSVAFHPDYAANGAFFVNYTDRNGDTVVSRFQVSPDDPNRAQADNEQLVLAVAQPYANHNGGQLLFGPDGYLYIGMGDGGSGGDPQNNGQNPDTLLGSLLRLDVDDAGDDAPYAIPPDNPFVNGGGAPEAWAYGLRNPWRISIDPLTHVLYVADVGQNQYEEVNALPLQESAGANFGWNIMEGLHCFNSADCDTSGLALPVVEYSHEQGGCSVTGGYVYRGAQHEALTGHYFFGDYCSGFIWSLYQDETGQWTTGQGALVTVDGQITSFGVDVDEEMYVVTREGVIYRVQP